MRDFKNKFKRNKGITLIALVITIIILFILIGVSAAVALRENGIIFSARIAAENYVRDNDEQIQKTNSVFGRIGGNYTSTYEENNNTNVPENIVNQEENNNNEVNNNDPEYIVTFNPKGGRLATTSKAVVPGERYGTLPLPTKIGYTFLGWFTGESNGNEVTANTYVAANVEHNHTIYAHWEESNNNIDLNDDIDWSSLTPGTQVTYTAGPEGNKVSDWEILYTTDTDLFIISTNNVMTTTPNSHNKSNDESMTYTGTTDFTGNNMNTRFQAVRDGWMSKTYYNGAVVQSNTNTNMKQVEWMLDSTNWSDYAHGTGIGGASVTADYAIGSPTKELVLLVYNKLKGTNIECTAPTSDGYGRYEPTGISNSMVLNTVLCPDTTTLYWLATPCKEERRRFM